MRNWQEKHFNLPPDTKVIRGEPEPERSATIGWWFLVLILISGLAASIAFALGYFETKKSEPVPTPLATPNPKPTTEQPPRTNITFTAKVRDEPRTISQARANELTRLITSRTNGIDLMTRDRSVAIEKKSRADNDLTAAKARLIDLEKRRPSANNSGALYQWNLAHSDAVAVAKNATNLIVTQQRVVDSFNNRIGKAETERNEAKAELDGATISP